MKLRVLALAVVAVIGAILVWPPAFVTRGADAALIAVTLPDRLSASETVGGTLFGQNCASCHGELAGGVEGAGPPLVHVIYEPGHHPDGAFYAAVQLGVRAHHWDFGDMPRIPSLREGEITAIIAYIRALQRANGIF